MLLRKSRLLTFSSLPSILLSNCYQKSRWKISSFSGEKRPSNGFYSRDNPLNMARVAGSYLLSSKEVSTYRLAYCLLYGTFRFLILCLHYTLFLMSCQVLRLVFVAKLLKNAVCTGFCGILGMGKDPPLFCSFRHFLLCPHIR